MWLLVPLAHADAWHWRQLQVPCAAVDAVARGPDTLVLCEDAAWRVGEQVVPAEVPHGAVRVEVDEQDRLWFWSPRPAWVAPQDGDALAVPLDELTRVSVYQGAIWASSVGGAAAFEDGWAMLPVQGVVAIGSDRAGGAWIWDVDAIHHVVGDDVETHAVQLPSWTVVPHAAAVDTQGRPTWNHEGLWRLDDGPERIDEDVRAVAWRGEERWVFVGDAAGPIGDLRALPASVQPVRLRADGGEVLALVDGRVFRRQDGRAPALVESRVDAAVFEGADILAHGDFDGDGLQDVASASAGAGVRVWRQVEGGFAPAHVLDADGASVLACDLDADGRDELIVQAYTPGTLDSPLRAWRFPPRGPQSIDLGPSALDAATGAMRCLDVDADGDVDVWRGAGGSPAVSGWQVHRNDGFGRFTTVRGGDGAHVDTVFLGDAQLLLNAWSGHDWIVDGVDVSAGSGLDLAWGVPAAAWVGDLDADGDDDLVVVRNIGVRTWRNDGERFADDTQDRALAMDGVFDARPVVQDLDGDGLPEIVVRKEGSWSLWSLDDGAFVERMALGEGAAASPVDLGGDGDVDLIVGGILYENHGVGWLDAPSSGVRWGLAWLRPLDLGVAAGVAGIVALGLRRSRRLALALAPVAAGSSLVLADLGLGVAALPALIGVVLPWLRRRRGPDVAGYRLGPLLGSGGMGRVYEATAPDGGLVALKLVHAELLTSAEERARYRREAELGSQVEHPRVVRILGHGEWTPAEGATTAYLVMELVRGGSVRQLLDHRGALPVEQACSVARGLLEGLAAVHAHGIVHRDIKPENLCLDDDGQVKLMDFGAATRLGRTRTSQDVLGTLGYLAPEQAAGKAPTEASDLYACGVVLHELLVGRRPHPGDDVVSLLRQIVDGHELDLPEEIPAELRALVESALALDPDERPASAAAMARALDAWAGPAPQPPPRPARRSTGRWSLLLRLVRVWRAHDRPDDVAGFAVRLLQSDSDDEPPVPPTERNTSS